MTSEVLPAIRKNGVYATPEFVQKSISDPQWAITVLQNLVEVKKENERLEAENKEQKETISIMEPRQSTMMKCLIRKERSLQQ